jgi:hypothetical protein
MFLFETIKGLFKLGKTLFRVLEIVLILGFLWVVFIYLNNKIGILSPIAAILKSVFKGIRGAFSLIGIG